MPDSFEPSRKRVFLIVWLTGVAGVLSFLPAIPTLLAAATAERPLPIPIGAILLVACAQSVAFVAAATLTFVLLGPKVGVGSPIVQALAAGRRPDTGWVRGLGLGCVVGAAGVGVARVFAPRLAEYLGSLPLVTRLLYGGFTEEILIRGGLLPLVALGFAAISRAKQAAGAGVLVPAVVLTNAAFAVAHMPALTAMQAPDPWRSIGVVFVLTLPWGFLAWRHGLETSVAAHTTFHAVFAASYSIVP